MLLITGSSLVLVGIKAYVMICTSWNLYTFSEMEVTISYAMPGLLSIANTVINFAFRKDFRQQFSALVTSKKHVSRVQIVTARSK
ncbi:hypothetical protein Y032_0005g2273 [Ancylostoma ceylanicum]|uniref:Uncharacterized protein n=1 Tax=Ancylostoma ceylanicum TaxID=53326 RepID=A0A016VSQ2_9BILA|nr:hypothetical protein Y032_0005g2273 [Ancylostoma ceylanicum]